jgi:hypothetical protein
MQWKILVKACKNNNGRYPAFSETRESPPKSLSGERRNIRGVIYSHICIFRLKNMTKKKEKIIHTKLMIERALTLKVKRKFTQS